MTYSSILSSDVSDIGEQYVPSVAQLSLHCSGTALEGRAQQSTSTDFSHQIIHNWQTSEEYVNWVLITFG